jgi:hypothetical protein
MAAVSNAKVFSRITVNTYNKLWDMYYMVKEVGTENSDVITSEIYVGNPPQKIISGAVGPILPMNKSKKIFDCAGDAIIQTKESVLYDLKGQVISKFKHLGYQRECRQLDHTNIIFLQYNDIKSGQPINNILLVDSDGKILLKEMDYKSKRLNYDKNGVKLSLKINDPQLPG